MERFKEKEFPVMSPPNLTENDKELIVDFCIMMGYIVDFDNGAIIKDEKDHKVFIQKDYWGKIYAVKNRFTPKEEWECINDSIAILEDLKKTGQITSRFFEKYRAPIRAIFGILSFGTFKEIVKDGKIYINGIPTDQEKHLPAAKI